MEYLEAALACAQAGTACVRAAELEALSQSRNTALRTACADRSSTACQSALQDAKNAALDHANNSNEYQNWLKKNGTSLFGAINQPGNEKLLENIITHTTTADLTWKLDCAQAGSDCSRRGSMELLTQGEPYRAGAGCNDPLKTCSGVSFPKGDTDERDDGRRDQTLDRPAQVGAGP